MWGEADNKQLVLVLRRYKAFYVVRRIVGEEEILSLDIMTYKINGFQQ